MQRPRHPWADVYPDFTVDTDFIETIGAQRHGGRGYVRRLAAAEIVYRALAPLIEQDNNPAQLNQRGSVMGVTRRVALAGGVVAGVASGRLRRARAEAPIIKVGV